VAVALDGSGTCHSDFPCRAFRPKMRAAIRAALSMIEESAMDDGLYSLPSRRTAQATALPTVMRERLVGLGHAMRFLALLDRAAAALRRFEQFGRELARHRVLAALARCIDDPAHCERHAPRRTHLDRHL